ncbi:hypothetical protein QVD17_08955 [Tagetes erecta]|uniref:Uncharacterized protein n=1 Tax=Tagetes erecta TaxID=13708 RepID=A0AAD8KYG6_TARER|nr:hypothetical protein QVD17_08955 [Tagetes erecta]
MMKYRRNERIGIKKSFSWTNDPSTPIILDDGDNYKVNTMTRKPDVQKGIKRKSPVDGGDTDMSSDDNIFEEVKNDEHLSDDNEDGSEAEDNENLMDENEDGTGQNNDGGDDNDCENDGENDDMNEDKVDNDCENNGENDCENDDDGNVDGENKKVTQI